VPYGRRRRDSGRALADQEKIGKPWGDDELDVIVADYFAMLVADLRRQPYVKSHHSGALTAKIGRTHGSVEFKHQNISAVLDELGLPWIPGYKPARNYQNAIFDAIDRYLSEHSGILDYTPSMPSSPTNEASVFVKTPVLSPKVERPARLQKLLRKFDPVERDHRNRALGKAGEKFVLEVEQEHLEKARRPDLAKKVRWISIEEGDGAGYDILSFDPAGRERLIEVKTTNGSARTPFFLTRNEHLTAAARKESWQLYRVHLFSQKPRIFAIKPPLEAALYLRTETWRASFS
jgi:hypothetical protein